MELLTPLALSRILKLHPFTVTRLAREERLHGPAPSGCLNPSLRNPLPIPQDGFMKVGMLLLLGLWLTTSAVASDVGSDEDPPQRVRSDIRIGVSATVTPVIDGILSPGEWADADRVLLADPTTPARLYAKNDFSTLYLAISVVAPQVGTGTQSGPLGLLIAFDTGREPGISTGDDTLLVSTGAVGFEDLYETRGASLPPFVSLPRVGSWAADVAMGGTRNGLGVARQDGTGVVFEVAHPLRSGDQGRDITLPIGERVRMALRVMDATGQPLLEWPGRLEEREFYASLLAAGDLVGASFERLRRELTAAPAAFFTAHLNGTQDPLNAAEQRRQNLMQRTDLAQEHHEAGRTQAALAVVNSILQHVSPYAKGGWVAHEHEGAFAIYSIPNNLTFLLENAIRPLCGRETVGVTNNLHAFFYEDGEGDTSDWTASGLWHLTSNRELDDINADLVPPMDDCKSGEHCFWYGIEGWHNYDVREADVGGSVANSGELISPEFFIPEGAEPLLMFGSWEETEDPFITWDKKQLFFSQDGGRTYEPAPIYQGQRWDGKWVAPVADLRGASGCVRLKFVFDTVDERRNDNRGWVIDDVIVFSTRADLEWTPIVPGVDATLPEADTTPILVGDEKAGSGLESIGRLYAFTIDVDGVPHLAAHDMYSGWSSWTGFPGDVLLVPGSSSAVSWDGQVMIAARGQEDHLPYASSFTSTKRGLPELQEFEAVARTAITGRPALAAGPNRFHLAATFDPEDDDPGLLHARTASLAGVWTDSSVVPDVEPDADFNPAATVDPETGTLHVIWIGALGTAQHSLKEEGEGFEPPVYTGVPFAVSSPSAFFFNQQVHFAVQAAGDTLVYHHSNVDGTWGFVPSERDFESDDPPRLVEFLGFPLILTRDIGGFVRFFRVEVNVPDEPIVEELRAFGLPFFVSTTPVEAVRSYGEIYVAGRDGGDEPGVYAMASRVMAQRTFEELGLGFSTEPICRELPGGFPFREGDDPVNPNDECPRERSEYPPAIPEPAGAPSRFVAYSRLAALLWIFPRELWLSTDAVEGLEARLRGIDVVGKGSEDGSWFGLGYLDTAGNLDSNLGPIQVEADGPLVRFERTRKGVVDQEFTHPLYPIPTLETDVFVDSDADPDEFCEGNVYGDPCPYPGYYAFASDYARTSEDHDFIEAWRTFRLGDGNYLRERVQNGLCCDITALQDKYNWIRETLYDGQEFHAGKRCSPETCPPPAACPADPDELAALCGL